MLLSMILCHIIAVLLLFMLFTAVFEVIVAVVTSKNDVPQLEEGPKFNGGDKTSG